MLIVLGVYAGVIYLVFGKFKLLPWNGPWKSVCTVAGLVIALVVIGALNYLAPSGRVTVLGAAIGITPNVSGTVLEIVVEPNSPVETEDLLFRIDPEPFQTEVTRLQAALVEAETAASMRINDLDAVDAEIDGLKIQLEFGRLRRDDIVKLADRGVNSQFQLQEAVSTIGQAEAALRAASTRKRGLELRIASQVEDVDSAVAQVQQMLRSAQWKLEQTEVRAPTNGTVIALTLRPGNRVTILKPAVTFVPEDIRAMTGIFSQTATHALKKGSKVLVAMRSQPGAYFETVIDAVLPGTGEGTLQPTGILPTISQLLGSDSTAVRLEVPKDLPDYVIQFGATGSATVITPDAGPIAPLAVILFWVTRYLNYL